MTYRGLALALMISLGVHVVIMSSVGIVSYDGPGRTKPYTRIDFLGPILGKTAFDIMVGRTARIKTVTCAEAGIPSDDKNLAVTAKGRIRPLAEPGALQEGALDASTAASLSGWKVFPETRTGDKEKAAARQDVKNGDAAGAFSRKVTSRPDAPHFIKGQYGEKDSFRIKVKVLVNAEGNVIKAEPLTTTGYPQLDMSAIKFVKGWIYEPGKMPLRSEEWIEEEVILKAGE